MMKVFAHRYARLVLSAAGGLLVLGLFGVGAVSECNATAWNDIHRISWLEAEIAFRRTAVLGALENARNKDELDAAEVLLTPHGPYRAPESKGQSLSELTDSYQRLRGALSVKDPSGQPMRPYDPGQAFGVDTWLIRNFPTEQVGSFYDSSPAQLDSLRLAARQRLAGFLARRLLPDDGTIHLRPNCSGRNILSYLLSGGANVALWRAVVQGDQPSR